MSAGVSHLECAKCGVEFDYHWAEGISTTAFRLGKWRYMRCPKCKKWQKFDVGSTQVDPKTHHCELQVEYG